MVLKIGMWDAAASRGPSMKINGYYLLENCRMLNQENYLQGKLVEPKIRELSKQDEKDMTDPRFMALLEYDSSFFLSLRMLTNLQERGRLRGGTRPTVDVGKRARRIVL